MQRDGPPQIGRAQMTKTFSTSPSFRDADLTCFTGSDMPALLRAIRCNCVTGYVRQAKKDGPVSVPTRHVVAISEHLAERGWIAA